MGVEGCADARAESLARRLKVRSVHSFSLTAPPPRMSDGYTLSVAIKSNKSAGFIIPSRVHDGAFYMHDQLKRY